MRRGEALRTSAEERLEAALRSFRHDGATTPEILGRLGLSGGSDSKMKIRMRALIDAKKAGRWIDPIGRCRTRMRYWHADFLPAEQPAPSERASTGGRVRAPVAERGPVAAHRTGPAHDPWRVGVVGHVVDARECRPWASAAAACIGASA